MSAVVFYCRRSELTPHSKFTIRGVFSTGGSFGLDRVTPYKSMDQIGKNCQKMSKNCVFSVRGERTWAIAI